MAVKDVILTVTVMLGAGLCARLVADFLHLPHMLVLLAAGILLGSSVSDAIDVPLDSMGAQLVLTLGVSFILFHGGLQLSVGILRKVAVGLLLLVVPGVVLTALVTGSVAALLFGLPLSSGFLIGAALSPTDPAILVPLFERLRIRPKLSQTIIAESALNDPTGAVLALAFAGVVLSGHASLTAPMVDFLKDLAISTAMGVVFGIVLSAVVSSQRAGIWRESSAIAVLAVVAGSFFSIDSAGGSGYLGAFLAGLIVGNMDRLRLAMFSHHEQEMRVLVSTAADVMVMFVFITLGANLPWNTIADHFAPALGVLAALILLARPLAVLVCLLPDRRAAWTRQELLFLAWTRETGVVPAAIAGVIVAMDVPNSDLVVTTVAMAIVLTLTLQATTKGWLARRLDLLEPVTRVASPPGPGVPEPAPTAASP
jgi:cell volume regulation protein A